ncbi:MAG: transcription antitermination factor NusB [Planctomycetota bacterium]|jgi:N utilization substance protein B
MIKARHKARIVALQGLYQLDIQQIPSDANIADLIQPLFNENALNESAGQYACELIAGAWQNREKFDQMITGVSDHWDISRMAVVDRNILRMALFELTAKPDVPPRVAIDEAIEIGREFGAAETPHFINGVLDAIWKQNPDFKNQPAASDSETQKNQDNTEE